MLKKAILVLTTVTLLSLSLACVETRPLASPSTTITAATLVPEDLPSLPSRGFFMGLLPTAGEEQAIEAAYSQVSGYIEFVPVWGRPSPFYRLAEDLSGSWGQTFVDRYIRAKGMFPIVHISFMGPGMSLAAPPGMERATLSDPEWREAYKQAVLDVVKASRPLYLSLGNEVNRWYERYGDAADDPNGFQHYISLYEETYDAVKRLSPRTRVFCVFAREVVAEGREADLDVLGMFPPERMDLLVITSYPYAIRGITRPSDIPDDYYSRLLDYMPGKPLGFSELGWPSLDAFGGEKAQANFISQVVGRLTREQGVDLHMVGWAWLHDLAAGDAIGLVRRDGTAKLAYDAWRSISLFGKWLNG